MFYLENGGSFGLKSQCFKAKKGVHVGLKSQCFIMKKELFWAEKSLFGCKKGGHFQTGVRDPGLVDEVSYGGITFFSFDDDVCKPIIGSI